MDTLGTVLAGFAIVVSVLSSGFFYSILKDLVQDTQEEFKKVKRAVTDLQEDTKRLALDFPIVQMRQVDLAKKVDLLILDGIEVHKHLDQMYTKKGTPCKKELKSLGELEVSLSKLIDNFEHTVEDLWIQTNLNRKNIESLKRKVKKI